MNIMRFHANKEPFIGEIYDLSGYELLGSFDPLIPCAPGDEIVFGVNPRPSNYLTADPEIVKAKVKSRVIDMIGRRITITIERITC